MFEAILKFFTSLRVTVVCLLCLIVLIFFGTLYQVDHGIWQSQQHFFYSWLVTWKSIPVFPGGQLVLGVLFVNLLAAMLFRMHLSWRSLGISLVHIGLLLMLAGGWFTHSFAEDSFLTLAEGEGSNVTMSARDWELSLWKDRKSPLNIVAVDTGSFKQGVGIDFDEVSCRVEVDAYYPNSEVTGLGETGLKALKRDNDPQRDVPGAVVRVIQGETTQHIVLHGSTVMPSVVGEGDDAVFITLRRKRYPMPIQVTLHDFQKEYHPGSTIAAAFSSAIEVDVQGVKRPVLIEMNEPFRFKEYTFYQASFGNLGDSELSTFSVTQNYGRLIPYVATALTVIGLILHFVVDLRMRSRMSRRSREAVV